MRSASSWNRARRVADRPEAPAARSREPVERVDELARAGIRVAAGADRRPPQAIALTVKSRRDEVLDQVVAELDAMGPAVVGVVVLDPEGRDLEHLALAAHGHGPEAVLVDRAREQLDDLRRPGVGGEVPVGGRAAEQGVAQRPADDVRGVPVAPQPVEDGADRRRDLGREARRRLAAASGPGTEPEPQFRPRKRYVRQASFRASWRYGVNSE